MNAVPDRLRFVGIFSALLLIATPCLPQVSPEQAVRKILETIDEELGEIDRLLDQTRDQEPASGAESASAVEEFRDLLQETEGSQQRVVRGIEDLIEQLRSMQSPSGSGGDGEPSEQKDAQRSDDLLQDQQDNQRSESDQPDDTKAPRREPSGGKPKPQPGEDASSGEQNPKTGRNRTTGQLSEDGEEHVLREGDRARWGSLQRYDLHKHIRGGLPQVPEKYRRFLEAYQRANHSSRKRR